MKNSTVFLIVAICLGLSIIMLNVRLCSISAELAELQTQMETQTEINEGLIAVDINLAKRINDILGVLRTLVNGL